MIKFNQRF